MKKLTDSFEMKNGVKIPCIGFGTWQTPDGDTAIQAVKAAIKAGYRHIDAAAVYANESSVGEGIQESGIKRDELFVTSKVWNTDRGYDKTLKAFDKTLTDLKLGYIDLYLIHWPAAKNQFADWKDINLQTWKAMVELYKAGRIRAIGTSNFLPHHLEPLMDSEVKPMLNQIEFHPGQMQAETVKFCRENDMVVEAWSPLGTGKMLTNPTFESIATKYKKSVAQVCIKWCLQHDVLPLPKSVTPSRIEENAQVFDFALSAEDMKTIDAMPYCGGSGLNPDEIDF